MRLSRSGGYAKSHNGDGNTPASGPYTGRRNAPSGTVIAVGEVAPKLSKDEPMFKLRSGGTFAIQTHPKLIGGKLEDVPTNFIRVDKNRIPHKMRKRAKRNARFLAEKTM